MEKEEQKRMEEQQLDALIEEIWAEYADAPKLSDEEIDQIVKEARRFVQRKYQKRVEQ